MCQKEYKLLKARFLREQGLNQQEIADHVGVSTRMVRKYLKPDYQPKTRTLYCCTFKYARKQN